VKKNIFFSILGTLLTTLALMLVVAGCDHGNGGDDEKVLFGETDAQVYDMDGDLFTGNYTVNVRFLNADGKKRDVKVGTIKNGKLSFAISQSLLPNEDETALYPIMSGITMTPSGVKVARWEFCLTGTDAANATLGLECRKDDQSIMGSYGRSCQYFSSDATITGSVSEKEDEMTFTMSLQIDAKKGWNRTYEVLKIGDDGFESIITTVPDGIPSDYKWSFRNLSEEFK
jgi:hypothetical protein